MKKNFFYPEVSAVAGVYIGTVVGAGFASGQEILQFFAYFGWPGLVGIALATVLFCYFGLIILRLGARLNAGSHREVAEAVSGKYGGMLVDYTITFFLFGGLITMLAGSGAIFSENYGIPAWIGGLIMLFFTVATVLGGFEEVITAISAVAPVLIGSLLFMGFHSFFSRSAFLPAAHEELAVFPYWWTMALLYVSYNITLAMPILAVLGGKIRNNATLTGGALWGGAGLGLGAAAVFIALVSYFPATLTRKIPLLYAARQISPEFKGFFVLILLAEIYTTAVSSLFGFTARLFPGRVLNKNKKIILTGIVAFIASLFGFVNLVRFLYPLVGAVGLILLAGLAWIGIKSRI